MKASVRNLVIIGMFAAIISVMSQISIPLPHGVPVTLQTFAIALCGFTLGAKRGTAAVAIYILLGAFGIPVFTKFNAGPSALFGVTGGFIWGFLPMALICGLAQRRGLALLSGGFGLLICHALGTLQYAFVTGNALFPSFLSVSLPFLLKDAACVVLSRLCAKTVLKRFRQISMTS